MTARAKDFIARHEAKMKPLEIAAGLAWWDANTTGDQAAFARKEKVQNQIDEALSNPERFKEIKALKENRDKIDDRILARGVDLLFLQYLEKQVPLDLLKKITSLSNKVEQAFNAFRPVLNGNEGSENLVRSILKNSLDSGQRKEAWEAGKKVGAILEKDLRELVKARNEAARILGFAHFHELQLHLNEQNGKELLRLFNELDDLVRAPFSQVKEEIDAKLATQLKIQKSDLMPWHYHDPFFQEAPAIFGVNLDGPFVKADLLDFSLKFYDSIGLPIGRVIARSDLYEKKGKSPHAFCTDIDRAGDVRVLANIKQDDYWASTLLHEFGHAVYSSLNIPDTLPYILRGEAHILTTEGVAMMFERLTKKSALLKALGLTVPDPASYDKAALKNLQHRLLIFSRWCQVMFRFEKRMYENPDQDLNALWWSLVEKYQGLRKPPGRNAPDYASKIHVVSAPVYYHNYMMGELFASQVHRAICDSLYPEKRAEEVIYFGDLRVGKFMKEKVFAPGKTLPWNELTRHATGKELSPAAFARDFRSE